MIYFDLDNTVIIYLLRAWTYLRMVNQWVSETQPGHASWLFNYPDYNNIYHSLHIVTLTNIIGKN